MHLPPEPTLGQRRSYNAETTAGTREQIANLTLHRLQDITLDDLSHQNAYRLRGWFCPYQTSRLLEMCDFPSIVTSTGCQTRLLRRYMDEDGTQRPPLTTQNPLMSHGSSLKLPFSELGPPCRNVPCPGWPTSPPLSRSHTTWPRSRVYRGQCRKVLPSYGL